MTLKEQAEASGAIEQGSYEKWLEMRVKDLEALRVEVENRPRGEQEAFRVHGIVFDADLTKVANKEHPDWWQKVAFSLYSDICEMAWHAENLSLKPKESEDGQTQV